MTRFARATGSKGSNDKRPEDSTSWHEMKTSMLEKNSKNDPVKSNYNTEAEEAIIPSTDEILSVWADLVGESDTRTKEKLKRKEERINNTEGKNNKKSLKEIKSVEGVPLKKKKRKLEVDSMNTQVEHEKTPPKKKTKVEKESEKYSITHSVDQEKKKNLKADFNSKKRIKQKKKMQNSALNLSESNNEVTNEEMSLEKKTKKKKKNAFKTMEDTKANQTKTQEISKKRFEANSPQKIEISNGEKSKKINPSKLKNALVVAEEKPKVKKRRKEELKPSEVYINGKPVQVAPFDGFVVQAEDAERLRELRKNMKAKGIPETDREKAIKLERRRAEKSLARLKKKVCFHCRGSGHNLSECPQVAEDQRSTGICYKCGSTEHTHYQCRVTKADDYRYAECFICKEQGHISKQCPDNPRGLYPRGGGCITCGDVTHLKKDCPKYLAEKEDEAITVGTRNNRALEAIDEDLQPTITRPSTLNKKTKQHIKF